MQGLKQASPKKKKKQHFHYGEFTPSYVSSASISYPTVCDLNNIMASQDQFQHNITSKRIKNWIKVVLFLYWSYFPFFWTTNSHKFSSLKRYLLIRSQLCRSETSGMVWLGPLFQGITRQRQRHQLSWIYIWRLWEKKKSTFKLILIAVRI